MEMKNPRVGARPKAAVLNDTGAGTHAIAREHVRSCASVHSTLSAGVAGARRRRTSPKSHSPNLL